MPVYSHAANHNLGASGLFPFLARTARLLALLSANVEGGQSGVQIVVFVLDLRMQRMFWSFALALIATSAVLTGEQLPKQNKTKQNTAKILIQRRSFGQT